MVENSLFRAEALSNEDACGKLIIGSGDVILRLIYTDERPFARQIFRRKIVLGTHHLVIVPGVYVKVRILVTEPFVIRAIETSEFRISRHHREHGYPSQVIPEKQDVIGSEVHLREDSLSALEVRQLEMGGVLGEDQGLVLDRIVEKDGKDGFHLVITREPSP